MTRSRRRTTIPLLPVLLISMSLPAGAQARQAPAPAPRPGVPAAAAVPSYLLREGTVLQRVSGIVAFDGDAGGITVAIEDDRAGLAGYMLVLLPGLALTEIVEALHQSRDGRERFEISGRVLVHRERNYLLLTQPAVLLDGPSPAADTDTGRAHGTAPADARDAPANARATGSSASEADDSTAAIVRELRRAVGQVPRRSSAASVDDGALAEPVPEGTRLVLRRGRVRRDQGGAMTFVFDADATGRSDPPVTLLPCLMLERLEALTADRSDGRAILISGAIYAFGGRSFLLPTMYRVPDEQTPLAPRGPAESPLPGRR
ncbi:MAG: hypothetical protein KF817_12435 [Phycisphaeraceae bacterium]|nr:hypothetical protein [Phycisphaeraceae bacterium]